MKNVLFISVKPEYAHKIISGEKTIELRKVAPKASENDIVIIYSTNPEKAIIGICKVASVIKLKPTTMWANHKNNLGINKKSYTDYYRDADKAVGIVLKSACKLDMQIDLSAIKQIFPKFSPPQTYRYYTKNSILRTYLQIASR